MIMESNSIAAAGEERIPLSGASDPLQLVGSGPWYTQDSVGCIVFFLSVGWFACSGEDLHLDG